MRTMPRLAASDRRDNFIAAAIEVMIEKGFAHATTRDVAAKIGVGRGLLHHYFPTWPDLQRAALKAMASASQADTQSRTGKLKPVGALEHFLSASLADPDDGHWRLFADGWDEAQRDGQIARIYIEMSDWSRRTLVAIIASGVETGDFACRDVGEAAWHLTALADGLSSHLLLAGAELKRARALEILQAAARRALL